MGLQGRPQHIPVERHHDAAIAALAPDVPALAVVAVAQPQHESVCITVAQQASAHKCYACGLVDALEPCLLRW